MARLETYTQDAALSGSESLLGNDLGVAKNYRLSKISDYILGLKGDRKIPVKSQSNLTTITPDITEGTRYINTTTGYSIKMGIDVVANNIYEILDGTWYEIVTSEGFNVWNKEIKKNLYFDGSAWINDAVSSEALKAVGAVLDTDVIDEDTMISNSDTKVPTQQSVKTYADSLRALSQAEIVALDAEAIAYTDAAEADAKAYADGLRALSQAETTALDLRADNLEDNQVTGVVSYTTLASLPVTGVLLTSYKVTNDPTTSNNGYYHWSGSAYVKDADLANGIVASGNVDPVSGNNAYDFISTKLLDDIKNTIPLTAFENGILLYNNGAESPTTAWKRSDFIPIKKYYTVNYTVQITPTNNTIFLYDENKIFLRALFLNTTAWQLMSGSWENPYSDAFYIRVQTLSETHPSYQVISFNLEITYKSDLKAVKDSTDANTANLASLVDNLVTIPITDLENGIIFNGAESPTTYWKRTDFIPIKKYDVVTYNVSTYAPNNAIFLYDESFVFLQGIIPNTSGGTEIKTGEWVNTYDDVKYFRTHTLDVTHPNYIATTFSLTVLQVSNVSILNSKVDANISKMVSYSEVDLELQLADLLITRDEHIAKIENGDYGTIVNGNDFKVGTQTERLQRAILFIKKMGKGVLELTQDTVTSSFIWEMSESLLMPSNFTLLIRDGVTLKKQDGIFDTLLRNDGIIPDPLVPYGKASELLPNENINIILADTAYINDLDVAKFAGYPTPSDTAVYWYRDDFGWRTLTLLFANCRNYSVKGGNFNNGKCWSISNESGCENFVYDGVAFKTTIQEGDGIDVRKGCKNFVIRNITGSVGDDLVALTCLVHVDNIRSMEVGGYSDVVSNNYKPKIENGIVYNINGLAAQHLLIVLCGGSGAEIHNIRANKIEQEPSAYSGITPASESAVVEVFTGYFTPYALMGQMTNIYVNDVINVSSPFGALRLGVPIQDSFFNKLQSTLAIPTVTYSTKYVEGVEVYVENVTNV